MAASTAKKEVVEVVRPRAFIVGLIAVVIMTFITTFIAMFTNTGQVWTLPITEIYLTYTWLWPMFNLLWPFIAAFVTALLPRGAFNRKELTLIISMLWVTWMIPTYFGIVMSIDFPAAGYLQGEPLWSKWRDAIKPVAWTFGPDPDVEWPWRGLYEGGSAVPWGVWIGMILYQSLFHIFSFQGALMLVGTLFRRQWVDIEKLPFPMATAGTFLIDAATSGGSKRPRILTNVWLYLGIIATVAEMSPLWLPALFPAYFPVSVQNVLGWDLTPLGLVPYPIAMVFNFELYYIGMAYLVPTRLLLSFLICYFITDWILPPIWVSAGLWDRYTGGATWTWWIWTRGGWGSWGPVSEKWARWAGGFYGTPAIGVMLAVILLPLYRLRREIAPVVSSIWKKPPRELEEKEPIPWRQTWLLLVIFLVIWTGMLAYAGAPLLTNAIVPMFFSYVLFGFVLPVGIMFGRAYGSYGGLLDPWNAGVDTIFNEFYAHWYIAEPWSPWYYGGAGHETEYLRAMYAGPSELPMGWINMQRSGSSSTLFILDGYKMASHVGLHPREIFKAYWIVVPLTLILTLVLGLHFSYTWGLQRKLTGFNILGWPGITAASFPIGFTEPGQAYACSTIEFSPGILVAEAVGFAAGSALYALTLRFPWWPIHPVGLAVALTFNDPHFFMPMLVAYVAKVLTIKIGGVKLYEEKGVPFAVGTMVAIGILLLISGFATAVRALAGV